MENRDYIRPRITLYHAQTLESALDKISEGEFTTLTTHEKSAILEFGIRLAELIALFETRQRLRELREQR